MSSKDLLNSRTPSSYSTVVGGHQERENKKKAEFTADDFPALSNSTTRSSSFDEHVFIFMLLLILSYLIINYIFYLYINTYLFHFIIFYYYYKNK